MKRICSLFLTLLMILALSVPAGAVNNDIPSEKIIITYNNGSTIKYCGHSNDRLDEEGTATVLEPTENDFLIFKF